MGINTSHKGLSVRLLRSASLLGLLHLYRFIFVVGVLQVKLCPSHTTAELCSIEPAKSGSRRRASAVLCSSISCSDLEACQGHRQRVIHRVSWRGMSGIPRSSA